MIRKVRKSPAMYKRIHGNFLDLLFRRQLDRAPANSHASRVQATPPPCQLCSQKVQNCLPNAYYTWRGSFYCIGHVKNDVCTQTVVGLYKKWTKYLIHSLKGICLFTALLGRSRGILDWARLSYLQIYRWLSDLSEQNPKLIRYPWQLKYSWQST